MVYSRWRRTRRDGGPVASVLVNTLVSHIQLKPSRNPFWRTNKRLEKHCILMYSCVQNNRSGCRFSYKKLKFCFRMSNQQEIIYFTNRQKFKTHRWWTWANLNFSVKLLWWLLKRRHCSIRSHLILKQEQSKRWKHLICIGPWSDSSRRWQTDSHDVLPTIIGTEHDKWEIFSMFYEFNPCSKENKVT